MEEINVVQDVKQLYLNIPDMRHGKDYWIQNAGTIGQNQNGIGHVVRLVLFTISLLFVSKLEYNNALQKN